MLNLTSNYTWLIYVCFFLVFFLFSIGVSQFISQQGARKKLVGKIRFGDEGEFITAGDQQADSEKPSGRFSLINIFGRVGRTALPATDFSHSVMRLKFLRAGIRHENALSVYWGFKIFCVVAFPAIFMLAKVTVVPLVTYQVTMIVVILCALLGFYLPDIWLRQKADNQIYRKINLCIRQRPVDRLERAQVCHDRSCISVRQSRIDEVRHHRKQSPAITRHPLADRAHQFAIGPLADPGLDMRRNVAETDGSGE